MRRAGSVATGGAASAAVTLTHAERFRRRAVLTTDDGESVLLDLPRATDLRGGDRLVLDDGRLVEVIAAAEDVLEVSGPNLARLAWHVGNRHAPCQIEPGRLLIRADPVLRDMLRGLGATVREAREPFAPEGGAYGHGRTHAHPH